MCESALFCPHRHVFPHISLSHGRCHREWADQTEKTGSGAASGPTLHQPTEEEPQQEQESLQWQPGGHLLQSAHLRTQEAETTETRSGNFSGN